MLPRVALLTLSLGLPAPVWAAPEAPPLQRPAAVGAPVDPVVPADAAVPAVATPVEPGVTTPVAVTPVAVTPVAVTPVAATPVQLSPRPGARRPVLGPEAGVYEAQPGAVAPPGEGAPRYFRAPFAESLWPGLVGHELLLVLGSGARECVTLTKKTPEALYFKHRKNGNQQQAPLSAVTSIHEYSWECQTRTNEATPSEWARSGAAAGLTLSGIGALMGGLYDSSHPDPRCELRGDKSLCQKGVGGIPHFMYAILGVSTITLGTPVVAIGGASTSRDLRVQGKIWARAAGWTLYSAATLLNVLWLTGFYGKVESLQVRGLTTGAGLLGLGGSGFMAVDALLARKELNALRRQDAQVRTGAGRGLRIGAAPIGQAGQLSGMTFGIGGKF